MRKLLREPLAHFLVLGAGLFLLFSIVGDSDDRPTGGTIVVSAAKAAQLEEIFTRTWQRPPTEEELDGLIEDHIREEVYYREALAMGLDRDDTIVRRRLRQKLEFFTDDLVAAVDPTEEQLASYLDEHADAFRLPSRVSFQQIYFSRDRRGEQATRDAESLLARLNESSSHVDTTPVGDELMLPGEYDLIPEPEVTRLLGSEFAAALAGLPVGGWSGPVESGFGLHLVLIHERQPASLPALAEVRQAVEREWRNVRRKETTELFYGGLRERYEVSVERREADDPDKDARVAEARQ
jgi:hypothetical protein